MPPPVKRHPGGQSLCEVAYVPGSVEAGTPVADMTISNDARDCAFRLYADPATRAAASSVAIAVAPAAGQTRVTGQTVVYSSSRGQQGEDAFAAIARGTVNGQPAEVTVRFRVQVVPGPGG